MKVTSEEYKNSVMSADDTSQFSTTFGFVPDGLEDGQVLSSSEFVENTSIASVDNEVKSMGGKWASLEYGRVKCNGTYEFPKDDGREVGLWLAELSNEDGDFENQPYLSATLNATYDLIGVSLWFDDVGQEWATSITLDYLDGNNDVIATTTINNADVLCKVDLQGYGVSKIKVTFNRWSQANKHVKLVEFLAGQFFTFDSSNTYAFEFEQSFTPFSTTVIPVQKVDFDNISADFDIANPTGLAQFLRERMPFDTKITVENQEVSLGYWLLGSWSQQSNNDTAFFYIYPPVYFEKNTTTAETTSTITVSELLADLETTVIIDENVDVEVNAYIGENVSIQNLLTMVANAVGGYWVFHEDGSIQLKKIEVGTSQRDVEYSQAFAKPTLTQTDKVTGVKVEYTDYFYSSLASGYLDSTTTSILVGNETGTVKTIQSTLIPTEARATEVGERALAYWQNRLTFATNFKGDASLELSDVITMETDYSDQDGYLTSLEILWSDEIIKSIAKGVIV